MSDSGPGVEPSVFLVGVGQRSDSFITELRKLPELSRNDLSGNWTAGFRAV